MKKLIKKLIYDMTGYKITKDIKSVIPVGSDKRPIGEMEAFLEDVKLRGLDCKFILDVGANRGDWSRMAKKVFPYCDFGLIEPQIEMKLYLDNFVDQHKSTVVFMAGAGSKEGHLTLTVSDDMVGSSFLHNVEDASFSKSEQRLIDIITIDSLIEEKKIKILDLIKLDVQGFELEVLKGATKTFGYTDIYIIETSLFHFSDLPGMPDFAEVVNFMLDKDYVVYDFAGFLRRPLDGALGQTDICFVKRNSFLRKSNDWG